MSSLYVSVDFCIRITKATATVLWRLPHQSEHTLNMHVAFNSLHLCLFLSLLVPVFANTEIINIHAALNHDVLLPETAEW